MKDLILGLGLIVGIPLFLMKFIEYQYTKKKTELQRSKEMIYVLIILTLVSMIVLGMMEL